MTATTRAERTECGSPAAKTTGTANLSTSVVRGATIRSAVISDETLRRDRAVCRRRAVSRRTSWRPRRRVASAPRPPADLAPSLRPRRSSSRSTSKSTGCASVWPLRRRIRRPCAIHSGSAPRGPEPSPTPPAPAARRPRRPRPPPAPVLPALDRDCDQRQRRSAAAQRRHRGGRRRADRQDRAMHWRSSRSTSASTPSNWPIRFRRPPSRFRHTPRRSCECPRSLDIMLRSLSGSHHVGAIRWTVNKVAAIPSQAGVFHNVFHRFCGRSCATLRDVT